MPEHSFLDPLNDPVFPSSFQQQKKDLMYRVELLQMSKRLPLLLLSLLLLLPIIAFAMAYGKETDDTALILYSAIPALSFLLYIPTLQDQIGLYLLAKQHNWAYNPERDGDRLRRFQALFPTVFSNPKTEYVEQYVKDQLWGSITYKETVDFWTGLFVSTIDEERKHSIHEKTVIIIKLPEEIPHHAQFTLYRHHVFQIGTRSKLRTESAEFNILYGIKPMHEDHRTKLEIFKLLSPSVQVRLIDFAHTYDVDTITFQHNCMVVLFNGKIWQTEHTNFFKNAIIDERDVKAFDTLIRSIVALPAEMIKFLD